MVPIWTDEVAGAIADDWSAGAAECREDQVGQFAFVGRMAGFDGDELGEELRLVDVEAAALCIGEAPGSDFGGAAVVEDAGVPG